jgi:hypothetical protein
MRRVERATRQVRAALGGLFDQRQPFGRLALVHTLFSGATTLVTISLAGSLFFSVSPSESKSKVLLYLLLTIAPFAVVAPALSPILDRGVTARRASVAAASGGSAVLVLLMARDIHGLLLFPEAFGILVLSKLYMVTRAALVPSMTEGSDDLATSNAKLAVLAALAGFLVSPIGIGLLQLGAVWVLRFTSVVFVAGVFAALRLPKASRLPGPAAAGSGRVAPADAGPGPYPAPRPAPLAGQPGGLIYEKRAGSPRSARLDVKAERRRLGLQLIVPEVTVALSAMTVLRGTFGFLTLFLAFELRAEHAATWWYGFILLTSGIGGLVGSMSVPTVRRHLTEQQLILAALVITALAGVLVALSGSIWSQPALTFVVGYSSTAAKPAFDSIAQRYVPPAMLGRAFARFETQLQLAWVLSALVAVLVTRIPFRAGDLLVAAACGIAAAFHLSMRHSLRRRPSGGGGGERRRRASSRREAESPGPAAPATFPSRASPFGGGSVLES